MDIPKFSTVMVKRNRHHVCVVWRNGHSKVLKSHGEEKQTLCLCGVEKWTFQSPQQSQWRKTDIVFMWCGEIDMPKSSTVMVKKNRDHVCVVLRNGHSKVLNSHCEEKHTSPRTLTHVAMAIRTVCMLHELN